MINNIQFGAYAFFSLLCFPFLSVYQILFKGPSAVPRKDLRNFIIVITGANTGIGKCAAVELCKMGATVVLACRSEERGNAAAEDITFALKSADPTEHPFAANGKAEFMKLDLNDLFSVKAFAVEVKNKYNYLNIIVNNAGLNNPGVTKHGLQQLFQANYLGHYLLYSLLEPLLLNARSDSASVPSCSRVVNVSSVMHHLGNVDFKLSAYTRVDKNNRTAKASPSAYDDSKLYMNFFSYSINTRRGYQSSSYCSDGQRPILAVSINPGAVRSDIWRHLQRYSWFKVYDSLMQCFYLTVEQGAASTLLACVAEPEQLGVSRSKTPMRVGVKDDSIAIRLEHPHIPYVVPYYQPLNWLCFEMLAPFAGPQPRAHVSLPPQYRQISSALWTYSDQLCNSILSGTSGSSSA